MGSHVSKYFTLALISFRYSGMYEGVFLCELLRGVISLCISVGFNSQSFYFIATSAMLLCFLFISLRTNDIEISICLFYVYLYSSEKYQFIYLNIGLTLQ